MSSSTRITTYQICEYSLYKTLLMMDRWGPKHVELTYVMNKLTHWNTLCILLDCIYITRWYTVPTVSGWISRFLLSGMKAGWGKKCLVEYEDCGLSEMWRSVVWKGISRIHPKISSSYYIRLKAPLGITVGKKDSKYCVDVGQACWNEGSGKHANWISENIELAVTNWEQDLIRRTYVRVAVA